MQRLKFEPPPPPAQGWVDWVMSKVGRSGQRPPPAPAEDWTAAIQAYDAADQVLERLAGGDLNIKERNRREYLRKRLDAIPDPVPYADRQKWADEISAVAEMVTNLSTDYANKLANIARNKEAAEAKAAAESKAAVTEIPLPATAPEPDSESESEVEPHQETESGPTRTTDKRKARQQRQKQNQLERTKQKLADQAKAAAAQIEKQQAWAKTPDGRLASIQMMIMQRDREGLAAIGPLKREKCYKSSFDTTGFGCEYKATTPANNFWVLHAHRGPNGGLKKAHLKLVENRFKKGESRDVEVEKVIEVKLIQAVELYDVISKDTIH